MTMGLPAAASPGSVAETGGLRATMASIASRLGRVPPSLQQLLFRLAVAGVFLRAGIQKVRGWETTLALFADEYKLPGLPPDIAAVLATCFEIGCSTLLVLGLAARLATLPLLGMIVIIQLFVYPQAWPEHLVWGSILLFLLTRGPGSLSLDRLFGIEPQSGPWR
jgi:putative oxidoreductase